VHCSITIDWSLVRPKLSIKLILSESPSSLKNSPASTTDFGQLVLVDLDVGKPVKRTALALLYVEMNINLKYPHLRQIYGLLFWGHTSA
jgi:hypothetical protein